jgi:hypothetical protein
MALFIKQSDERSKLQQRIAAELQEKAKLRASDVDLPDGVGDSRYLEETKETTGRAWIWIVAAIIAVLVILSLTAISSKN